MEAFVWCSHCCFFWLILCSFLIISISEGVSSSSNSSSDQPILFDSIISFNRTNRFALLFESGLIAWPLHQIPAMANLSLESSSNLTYNSQQLPLQRYHAVSAAFLCYVSNSTTAESYILSVLLTGVEGGANVENGMIVWMANRNHPASGGDPWLGMEGPNLVLKGGNGETVWRINANVRSQLKLLGDGNLLISDVNETGVVWQSFDYPTDTFVMGQVLALDNPVVSRTSSTDLSSGAFSMGISPDTRVVFYYAQGNNSRPYFWTSSPVPCNKTGFIVCASLDFSVGLSISVHCSQTCDKNSLSRETLVWPVPIGSLSNDSIAILRLQPNGDFVASTCGRLSTWTSLQSVLSTIGANECDIPLHCGPYTTCFPSNATCSRLCITDSGESCDIDTNHQPGPSCEQASAEWKMGTVTGRSYLGNGYNAPVNVSSEEECGNLCFHNCSCTASFYDPQESGCFLITTPLLLHLTDVANSSYMAFIKMPSASATRNTVLIVAVSLSAFALLVFLMVVVAVLKYRKHRRPSHYRIKRIPIHEEGKEDLDDDEFLRASLQSIVKYSYREIHVMTDGFASEIGRGAFGRVYEGLLPSNQQRVAVKILDSVSRQGSKEFRAEVAVMAGISHWNLVKLFGFCIEGFHRVLVYELMPNGSLDSRLFRTHTDPPASLLMWAARFQIAVGVASGLAYLHEGCSKKIIHLDIKPQNILLDQNFNAKVGDFGLSRLMNRDESFALTTMRGTPGYLAPEWLLNGGITDKMDVYSFGMVLLELVSGRKNYIPDLSEDDKRYFPAWAFEKIKEGKDMDLLDPRLHGESVQEEEEEQMRRAMKVAFLCIEEDPESRPRMSSIVKMLEGEEIVPQPNLDRNIHRFFQSRVQRMPDASDSMNPVSFSLSCR